MRGKPRLRQKALEPPAKLVPLIEQNAAQEGIYRKEGLKVGRRGGRKRALGTRAPMAVPREPNQRWSLDFVSDAFAF